MAPRTIEIAPESDIARLLDQNDDGSVIEVKDGARFRVVREKPASGMGVHEPEGGYDPQRVIQSMRQAAGTISVEEAERIKAYIYAGRRTGSRLLAEDGRSE